MLHANKNVEASSDSSTKHVFQTSNITNPYESLLEAIKEKDPKKLLRVLESGASQDVAVVSHGLKEGYAEIKHMIADIDNQIGFHPHDNKLKQQREQMETSKKILSIFLTSTMYLERALNLQHWASFELHVANADFTLTEDMKRKISANAKLFANISTCLQGEKRGRSDRLVSFMALLC